MNEVINQVSIVNPFVQVAPHASTSSKYCFIDTQTLLDHAKRITGFEEVSSKAVNTRVYKGYQKHFSMLRSTELDGDSLPTLFIRNSHKAGSVVISIGYYRCCCENQMPFTIESYSFNIKHLGNPIEVWAQIRYAIATCMDKIQELRVLKAKLQAYVPDDNEIFNLVAVAVKNRPTMGKLTVDDITTRVRAADFNNDLWTILNVIQEKAVDGMGNVRRLRSDTRKNEITVELIKEALLIAA